MKFEKNFIFIMPILLIIAVVLGYIKIINTQNDQLKFRKEYENLNNSDKYYKISIDKKNQIKYSSYKEIFKVLKEGTNIIYFGYPKDNNSRFAIETLLKVIKNNNINTKIYYLDIYDDRDSYVIENDTLAHEKDKKGNEIKGSKEYFKLMDYLDEFLGDYVLYFEDKEYYTNEKRIPVPSIVFVKNGEILGLEYGSLDMPFDDLYLIYEDYIIEMYSNACEANAVGSC